MSLELPFMMTLERLWRAVSEHVVLLLVLLPALGACMTRLIGAQSIEGGRSIARANSWISLLLMLLVVAQFEVSPDGANDVWQMRSAISWVSLLNEKPSTELAAESQEETDGDAEQGRAAEPATPVRSSVTTAEFNRGDGVIRIAVGVDGIGLVFAVLVVATGFAVVRSVGPGRAEHLQLADVLFVESALLAVLTATDAVWLSVSLLLATGAMFALISRVGEPQRRVAATKFLRSQLLGTLMLMAGGIGLAVSCWWMSIRADRTLPLTFDLPTIIDRVPRLMMGSQAANDHWELTGSWLFFLITGGCLLRVPMPPFHPWLPAVAQQTERSTLALLIVGWIPTSFVLGLRLLVRVFELEMGQLGERVLIWCAVAAFGTACASIAVKEPRRRFVLLMLAATALCFGGLWTGSRSATQGAAALLAGTCSVGALSLLKRQSAASHHSERLLVGVGALLAIVPGGWCLLRNLLAYSGLWLWSFGTIAAACWSIASWPRGEERDAPEGSIGSLLPLVVAIAAIGLAPQVVLDVTSHVPAVAQEAPPVAE